MLVILVQIIYHHTILIDHMLVILSLLDTNQDHQVVPKKRSRNEHLWKKNVRKFKKIRGESYVGATGKICNKKTFVPIICKCFKKFHNFIPDAKQKEINNTFYNLGNYNLQTAYLFGLK